ncbi:hypothetical protein AURDEDRAFT_176407 [Auricularia subglabra TFB-10046 SS5]|uniref:Uncharacterized protein n=1 Tax=Auricularia subglabra (strain TFB-10046 / SS5) TaxID=717982 RepID=J0D6S6_AURST|nr:hypothetical protein AURDEDRAFT_176407 [Auricularia subglabra TFB-10046 SS5]
MSLTYQDQALAKLMVDALPILILDTYLFVLSALKLMEAIRQRKAISKGRRESIVCILIQDSFKYYAVAVTVVLFQVFIFARLITWSQYTEPITSATLPIAGTRLILNIRKASEDTRRRRPTLTTMSIDVDPGLEIAVGSHLC